MLLNCDEKLSLPCKCIVALKINHCDEYVLMWIKFLQWDKISSMLWKFIDVMKIYWNDENLSMWWKDTFVMKVITVMKSLNWDENLSLWWKFKIVMKSFTLVIKIFNWVENLSLW